MAIAALLLLPLAPHSDAAAASAEPSSPRRPAPVATELIRAAAEVVAIDPASRTLTLRREDGNTVTVVADKRIKNLAQVSVGDIVIAQYGHARAISLKKAGPAEAEAPTAVPPATAKAPRTRTLIADIIAIDDRTGQATLKGVNGSIVDVVFQRRKTLASVRIGDRVKLEYTDAVATSIKPAGQAISPRRPHSP